MSVTDKAWLYWKTIRYLKFIQIRYQIKNRFCKSKKGKLLNQLKKLNAPNAREINIVIPELDFDKEYLGRFQVEDLMNNEITLLHEKHKVDDNWNISDALHLWNYNLHYLEFLIPLAVKYKETSEEQYVDKFENIIEKWLNQSSADSFEAYTISMRVPNLLICMELLRDKLAGTILKKKMLDSIYQQYQYLLSSQELALLANHYFENIKAIVISSLLFGELDIYHKYFDLCLKQIDEQILEDGMHFERSPMYHKIILEDILRIYMVLISTEHRCDAEKLTPTIQKMTQLVYSLEKGFNRTPLFNDAGNNVSKSKEALIKAAENIIEQKIETGTIFPESGYYKMNVGRTALLFDCGEIGPSYMGGHAHCDCLSFELAVDGQPLFVNSGTGQYQGEFRRFFRSTSAHNTVMIDNREQSELWGEHRAGRRISKVKGIADTETDIVTGSFYSYCGDFFQRRLKWKGKNQLSITDGFIVHDKGIHIARQFFHITPDYHYVRSGKKILVKKDMETVAVIRLPAECDELIHKEGIITNYAEDFGRIEHKDVLEIRTLFEHKLYSKVNIEIKAEK